MLLHLHAAHLELRPFESTDAPQLDNFDDPQWRRFLDPQCIPELPRAGGRSTAQPAGMRG